MQPQLLRPAEVHLWLCTSQPPGLDSAAADWERWLSDDERRRYTRFHFASDRRLFLVSRLVLRRVLAAYTGVGPREVDFANNVFGRPLLAGGLGPCFSLTHTEGLVALAVSCAPVGLDAEPRERHTTTLAERALAKTEFEQWRQLAPALRSARLMDLWTLKEAYVKARGRGLTIPLQSFGFELSSEGTLRLTHADEPGELHRWHFRQWIATESHVLALCAERDRNVAPQVTAHWMSSPLGGARRVELPLMRASSLSS